MWAYEPFAGRKAAEIVALFGVLVYLVVAVLAAGGKFHVISPDAQTQDVFGMNLMDPSRRIPVIEQGMRQGKAIAAGVKAFWG